MSHLNGTEQRNPILQGPVEANSRKSSVAAHANANPKDSDPDEGTVATADLSDKFEDPSPLNLTELRQQADEFVTDPDGGREWLRSFEFVKPGTEVSRRLKARRIEASSIEPVSLFPSLAKWIRSWYQIAKTRRKAEKIPKHMSFKAQEDVDWLLQYIADYVCVGHEIFDDDELGMLCVELTEICQDSIRASDINASIIIFKNIIAEAGLPPHVLEDTLDVLCAATIILDEPVPELATCFKLLFLGHLRDATNEHLQAFITTPTAQNNYTGQTIAKGAIQQVRRNLDLVDNHGEPTINIVRLVDHLYQASKCCIFSFCTEIIRTCYGLLIGKRAKELLQLDWNAFMSTVENSVRTALPRATSTRSLDSLPSVDRGQYLENERKNERYRSERKSALKNLLFAFESTWSSLSADQKSSVGDFFMQYTGELNDSQALIILSHLKEHESVKADADDWAPKISKIIDSLVKNNKMTASTRLQAIELCGEAAVSAVQQTHEQDFTNKDGVLSAGASIVDRLLNQIGKEITTNLVRGALESMKVLVFCSGENGKAPFADLIIKKLVYFVRHERDPDDDFYEDHVLLFTRFIREVFIDSLHLDGTIASQAYVALVELSSCRCKSRRCRLAAMRLLVRLRCDEDGWVYVQNEPQSEYIAEALCRTEESRAAFARDPAVSRGPPGLPSSHAFSSSSRQLWSYPDELTFSKDWNSVTSSLVGVRGLTNSVSDHHSELHLGDWLIAAIECFQTDNDWEIYSYLVVHLGAQLSNTKLFSTSLAAIVTLRQVVCGQVVNNSFKDPPVTSGLKKSDTALCMFNVLTALIPYAKIRSETIQKGFGDDLVRAFLAGIGTTWDGTHRGCIHSLSVCCLELPASVASLYVHIVERMSKNMTQAHLTVHILEFLAQVARLRSVHENFTKEEKQMMFAICVQFLEKAREQQTALSGPSPKSGVPGRHSGLNLKRPPYRAAMVNDVGLPQYAAALAYNTMIFWFLSLDLEVRAEYVSWIVPRLIWKNAQGEETIDEQSEVFVDMMQRTAFSDLGETMPDPNFAKEEDGPVTTASWIVGLGIITIETAGTTGVSQITKRQAAGTTHSRYVQSTRPPASHFAASHVETTLDGVRKHGDTKMLPSHILLQLVTTAAPTSMDDQPIPLPQEDYVTRALNIFDRIPTVDSAKIGMLYIGEGQFKEAEYLANTSSSPGFEYFLNGLGTIVSLKPPLQYNPQGLQYPRDGDTTIAWSDRVTEIVFQIATMMPNNLEEDPACNMKKSHIGNCHVVVVFNESGRPWKMENFSSAVTFVHVVITPVNRASKKVGRPSDVNIRAQLDDEGLLKSEKSHLNNFYQVHVLTKENYPNISAAADPKVISKEELPKFIRMFALNSNVFSRAKVASDCNDDEFPSTWRDRLQQIKQLRERVIQKNNSGQASGAPSGNQPNAASGRRTPGSREDVQGPDRDGALALQLDFGKWTL